MYRPMCRPMWRETQHQFAAALRDPGAAVPTDISAPYGFGVYRNNVAVGLIDALADTFPVVHALVGKDFFSAMARIYSRLFLPSSPVLLNYGADFPDFIATQEETRATPYLADVARLEWAWNRAYHAADMAPITIDELAAVPRQAVENTGFQFHPSTALLTSPWPIVSIWQAHQESDPERLLGKLPEHGQAAMIVRPQLNVLVRALDPLAYDFVRALSEGERLGQASALVLDKGSLGLSGHLGALFETGAIIGLTK